MMDSEPLPLTFELASLRPVSFVGRLGHMLGGGRFQDFADRRRIVASFRATTDLKADVDRLTTLLAEREVDLMIEERQSRFTGHRPKSRLAAAWRDAQGDLYRRDLYVHILAKSDSRGVARNGLRSGTQQQISDIKALIPTEPPCSSTMRLVIDGPLPINGGHLDNALLSWSLCTWLSSTDLGHVTFLQTVEAPITLDGCSSSIMTLTDLLRSADIYARNRGGADSLSAKTICSDGNGMLTFILPDKIYQYEASALMHRELAYFGTPNRLAVPLLHKFQHYDAGHILFVSNGAYDAEAMLVSMADDAALNGTKTLFIGDKHGVERCVALTKAQSYGLKERASLPLELSPFAPVPRGSDTSDLIFARLSSVLKIETAKLGSLVARFLVNSEPEQRTLTGFLENSDFRTLPHGWKYGGSKPGTSTSDQNPFASASLTNPSSTFSAIAVSHVEEQASLAVDLMLRRLVSTNQSSQHPLLVFLDDTVSKAWLTQDPAITVAYLRQLRLHNVAIIAQVRTDTALALGVPTHELFPTKMYDSEAVRKTTALPCDLTSLEAEWLKQNVLSWICKSQNGTDRLKIYQGRSTGPSAA